MTDLAKTPEVHGLVQVVLMVFDQDRGWLSTKRSIIYGGRHGKAPLIELPLEELDDIVQIEVKTGLRALQHRWNIP